MSARDKPLVIYDGDCDFCLRQVRRLRRWTSEALDFAPHQEAAAHFPSIRREEFERSLQLVETDGRVFSGAQAVFRALATNPRLRAYLWCYRYLPGFAPLSEGGYRLIARHRGRFGSWLP